EARELHLLALLETGLDQLKDEVHDLARVLLRGPRPLVDPLDDVGLGHVSTSEATPRRSKLNLAANLRRSSSCAAFTSWSVSVRAGGGSETESARLSRPGGTRAPVSSSNSSTFSTSGSRIPTRASRMAPASRPDSTTRATSRATGGNRGGST